MKKEISPAIPSLNVALLRKVQNHILEEPRRLMMSLLAIKKGENLLLHYNDAPVEFPPCGTAACIAGWSLILSGLEPFTHAGPGFGSEKATDLLEIEDYQANRLFYTRSWPEAFGYSYMNAPTPKKRAQITSDRIDHFIKTGE